MPQRSADFTAPIKDMLAKKVGYHCSNPFCRKMTIGSNADVHGKVILHADGSGTINIGEAAHITAAAPGGPRYDPMLTTDERKAESNGIWLCRTHAAMIDRDVNCFTVDLLQRWKADTEKEANERIQRGTIPSENLQFNLRVLYDDLLACYEMLESLIKIDRAVVFQPERLPVPSEYEKKIESVVDSIGMDHASRMRSCYKEIEIFKTILGMEMSRSKGRVGPIADMRAARYDTELQAFIERMQKYDIKEIVETIGKLFESKE